MLLVDRGDSVPPITDCIDLHVCVWRDRVAPCDGGRCASVLTVRPSAHSALRVAAEQPHGTGAVGDTVDDHLCYSSAP